MRKQFLMAILPLHALIFAVSYFLYPEWANLFFLTVPLTMLGLYDVWQKEHTILRNFPVLGHFRYMLESIRPEIQQYFIERNDDGRPFSHEARSVVYKRAKGDLDTSPFGTQHNLNDPGSEWLEHAMIPIPSSQLLERVTVGGEACEQPYDASIFNISAMSYGSLSKTAIEALNKGAKIGKFAHNTGEGGVSPYHTKHGGDLVWQIGTGYFGCRNLDGSFNEEMFRDTSRLEQVKMIELKISQGAKPGHGGLLPGGKVTKEIAQIRRIIPFQDCQSPSSHTSFNTPVEMMEFLRKLRELSGKKPVGFKLCIGKKREFLSICKAMLETGIYPDFITVDGAEGGTGAAPREFSSFMGTPLNEGLNFVNNSLIGCGIRQKIKIIAAGKIVDPFSMVSKFALGADLCNSARGMMFAIGCIQALRCNNNTCPTGVATSDPNLYKTLNVEDKAKRVANYHNKTIEELRHFVAAAGIDQIHHLNKRYIKRRMGPGEILSYTDLYPELKPEALLKGEVEGEMAICWKQARTDRF